MSVRSLCLLSTVSVVVLNACVSVYICVCAVCTVCARVCNAHVYEKWSACSRDVCTLVYIVKCTSKMSGCVCECECELKSRISVKYKCPYRFCNYINKTSSEFRQTVQPSTCACNENPILLDISLTHSLARSLARSFCLFSRILAFLESHGTILVCTLAQRAHRSGKVQLLVEKLLVEF